MGDPLERADDGDPVQVEFEMTQAEAAWSLGASEETAQLELT